MNSKLYFLVLITTLSSNLALADDFKKVHDNIKNRIVEVCSEESDGTITTAVRCKYNLADIPFIARRADPIVKHNKNEVTEITSPIHTVRNSNSVYAIFNHALVEIIYSMADGRSNIMVYQPSDETPRKYSPVSGWIVGTNNLATEVDQIEGYKKGDKFCLKKSPTPYPDGLPVKITHLFNKDRYVAVDTVSDGFLGMGNTFKFYYTELSNLVKCEKDAKDKITLDPKQMIKTSAPQDSQDVKINTQQDPKENTLSPVSSDKNGSSLAK